MSKGNKTWMITLFTLIPVITVGIIFYALATGNGVEPGDCLNVKGRGGKVAASAAYDIVPCTAPNATYKLAKYGEQLGCDDLNYGAIVMRRGGHALCLILNAKVGDCFYQEVWFPTGQADKVPCGPSATYRVTAVMPGKTDPRACGEDVNPLGPSTSLSERLVLVYPDPPLTLCTAGV